MEAYLDNSATTCCSEKATEKMVELLQKIYGNPSALHSKGMEAEQQMRQAREIIGKKLKVEEKDIFFTSGGTEANNLAIIGAAFANQRRGKRIITSAIEHPSVAQPMKFLQENGFEVITLGVDAVGKISLEELEQELTQDTILVSIMYVNNEIGTIQPIEEIGNLIKAKVKDCVFHVDAIQGFGKQLIYPKKMKIDLLSVSGHKIHGPKGTGFLYRKEKTKLMPLLLGGGQEKGLRSGTENVPGIAALGVAVQECYEDLEQKIQKMYQQKEWLIQQVCQLPGTQCNGAQGYDGAPHIISISFESVRSEVLLHALEEKGVYASAGSACSSNKPAISATLKAIGLKENLLDSTLRFSLSTYTTQEELEYSVSVIKEMVPTLRKFVRR